ncbi:5426_t:CDS:2, partial [Racocetra persica]
MHLIETTVTPVTTNSHILSIHEDALVSKSTRTKPFFTQERQEPSTKMINKIDNKIDNSQHHCQAHQNRQQNRRQTIENSINIPTFEPTETRRENLDNKKSCPHDGYVLVTGGAGYIGSHTVLELLICGYNVIVIDNLSNACEESLIRVQKLARRPLKFYHANILDEKTLIPIFEKYNIWAVLHFAALKAVGESTKIPLDYYWNN